ncbi:cyclic pyranopterin monophosphate synthase MoaC [Elongatibacter sediminis]|uniref:Cyclic pyranopterin monophosphate synthase MoaC n=1 Tax=Elongatibacter sediminis TaxID=3119006 RepID=A0AAW9RC35_9GAMM
MTERQAGAGKETSGAGAAGSERSSSGHWSMADVSVKAVSRRVAMAGGRIEVGADAMRRLLEGSLPKGDPLAMAEIAGILAAKKTPELIPLCHPIGLNRVAVRFEPLPDENAVAAWCLAEIAERTGVEMEALTGLNLALLTIWDLVKPVEPALRISDVKLLYKSGGKHGDWTHPDGMDDAARGCLAEFTGQDTMGYSGP